MFTVFSATTPAALKACRQVCYDQFQDNLATYCPVGTFCLYYNYLANICLDCYDRCSKYAYNSRNRMREYDIQ